MQTSVTGSCNSSTVIDVSGPSDKECTQTQDQVDMTCTEWPELVFHPVAKGGLCCNIIYHILLWGGGGELGTTKVSIVYSIRMGGEELCLGEVHPLCSLSPSVSNLIN